VRIRWIGQSGYVIRTQTTEVLLDPYLSDAVNRAAGRPRLVEAPVKPEEIRSDAIICTHDHLDHLDTDAIARMEKQQLFLTTTEGRTKLRGMGFDHVQALLEGQSVIIGDMEITAVYAKHTVEAFGVVIGAENQTLYFSGDTMYDERLLKVAQYKPDIALLCINGRLGNMNVEEAVRIAKGIGARVNVPNHYGMFASNTEDPELFTAKLDHGLIMEFNKEYDISQILNGEV